MAQTAGVTANEALREIRGYASAGRVRIIFHAKERMRERGARFYDVQHALANAMECTASERGRWRTRGPDSDGDELTCIVRLENGVVVVTVF